MLCLYLFLSRDSEKEDGGSRTVDRYGCRKLKMEDGNSVILGRKDAVLYGHTYTVKLSSQCTVDATE